MPPVGFEPTISTGERPQTYAVDRAALGPACRTGWSVKMSVENSLKAARKSGRVAEEWRKWNSKELAYLCCISVLCLHVVIGILEKTCI